MYTYVYTLMFKRTPRNMCQGSETWNLQVSTAAMTLDLDTAFQIFFPSAFQGLTDRLGTCVGQYLGVSRDPCWMSRERSANIVF